MSDELMLDESPADASGEEADNELGFVLAWMVLIIGVLIAIAALSVDLVHAYAVAQRMQNAADAAATAGAVDIPTDTTGANARAKVCDILLDHYGVDCGAGEVPINDKASAFGGPSNEMRVKVRKKVDTFFARFIGFPSVTVSREAHAQYDAPVQMGSPANYIGGVPYCPSETFPFPPAGSTCQNITAAQHIWAQVQGPQSQKVSGNALTANTCAATVDRCIGGENLDFSPTGEYFQVRAESTGTLDIWVYDPAFVFTGPSCHIPAAAHAADPNPENQFIGANAQLPDHCPGDVVLPPNDPAMDTTFQVLAPDPVVPDADPTNNPVASCISPTPGTQTFPGFRNGPDHAYAWDADPTNTPKSYFHKWFKLCSVNVTRPTIDGNEYLVRVSSSFGLGTNGFSIMGLLNGSPDNVGVFARHRMPIYATNYTGSGSSDFFLARVLPSNQDRTLIVDFFDLGDASAGSLEGDLEIETSGVQNANFTCTWTPPPPSGDIGRDLPYPDEAYTGSGCSLRYDGGGGQTWNGRWISLKIFIEDLNDPENGYRCDTSSYENCWIKLRITPDISAGQSDATTWTARMAGSPVRIVQ